MFYNTKYKFEQQSNFKISQIKCFILFILSLLSWRLALQQVWSRVQMERILICCDYFSLHRRLCLLL